MLNQTLLGDQYESEINEKNPIGNRGDLARAYGDLMKQMWCGSSSVVAPRHFKVRPGVGGLGVWGFGGLAVYKAKAKMLQTV